MIADRFCINFITGLSELGVYSLGYKIANSIKVLLVTSVQLAINPMIYQMMSRTDNKRFYSKLLTYFCFGITICVLGVSVFSKEIVHLLAIRNPDYWGAYKVIPILSFAVLFGMCKDTSLIGLNLTKKTKIIGLVTIIISSLNIALNIFLISLLNSLGASIAALLSNLLFFVIIYHYAQKYYFIPYEVKKIGLLICLAILIFGISTINFQIPFLLRVGIKLCLVFSLPIVLYYANFYEPVEIQTIKGAWRKWRNPFNWKRNLSKSKFDNK
jgi:O-antigen/teichoic acid export membrane protein